MGNNGAYSRGLHDNGYTGFSNLSHNTSYGHENSTLQDEYDVNLYYGQAYFVIDCVILILGVLGNLWIIYFICQQKSRTTQNISIVSVAIADVLIAAIVMPSYLAVYKFSSVPDKHTPFLCKIYVYMWYWFKTVIAYSLLTLVCDRYYRVTSKTKSDSISGRVTFFLSFIWFFGAAYNIWEIVFYFPVKLVTDDENGVKVTSRRCILSGPYIYLKNGYIVMDFLVIYIFPLVAILYMYYIMLTHQWKSHDPRDGPAGRRRILLSACLVTLYYVCQLPFEVMTVVTFYLDSYSHRTLTLTKLVETISFSNGVFNFLAFLGCSLEFHQNVMGYLKTDLNDEPDEDEESGRSACRKRRKKLRRRSKRKTSGIEVTDIDAIEEVEGQDSMLSHLGE